MTSIGPICLGLTSALHITPFTFDATGHFQIAGTLPADPGFSGLTLFMQAIAASGTGVNPGLASSNGSVFTLASPKLVIIDPGTSVSPWSPCSFCIYDALTDTPVSPAIPLASHVLNAISIPGPGLVAFMLNDHTVRLYDVNTAALVATIVPPTGAAGPGEPSKLASDGVNLYLVYPGSFPLWGAPGAPGSVRSYSLPAGTPIQTMPLPAGNPDDLLIVPGSNIAYLKLQAPATLSTPAPSVVLPINLTTGATLPPINLGGTYGSVTEWTLDNTNGVVYCHMFGSFTTFPPATQPVHALSAFSTTTNSALFPSPAPLTGASSPYYLRRGPGTGGMPALFVQDYTFIYEVSPTTLSVINSIPQGGNLIDMRLSSGGTEWLLLVSTGTQTQLMTMAPPMLVPTLVATLPSSTQYFIAPLASGTVWKAYVAQASGSLSPFATDPAVPPTTSVTLPVSTLAYLVLNN